MLLSTLEANVNMLHGCCCAQQHLPPLLVSLLIHHSCPALQWPRAATGPRVAVLQRSIPWCLGLKREALQVWVGVCTTASSLTGGELSASNKHTLYEALWQMMGMKAVLCMQGSDLLKCFSAPASGIHITRENWVTKILNFCLGGERHENLVREFFPYFNKVFESSTFPYKKEGKQ